MSLSLGQIYRFMMPVGLKPDRDQCCNDSARVIWRYKLILAGAIAAGGVWGWHVAQQRSATLVAFDTNTGTVQWFQPLRSVNDFYSQGAIAANGMVVLGSAESSTSEQRFNTYQLQAFAARSGNHLRAKHFNVPVGAMGALSHPIAHSSGLFKGLEPASGSVLHPLSPNKFV